MRTLQKDPETRSFRTGVVEQLNMLLKDDAANLFGSTFFSGVPDPMMVILRALRNKEEVTQKMVDDLEDYRIQRSADGKLSEDDEVWWGLYIRIAYQAETPTQKAARIARGDKLPFRVYIGSSYRAKDGMWYRVVREHEVSSLSWSSRSRYSLLVPSRLIANDCLGS